MTARNVTMIPATRSRTARVVGSVTQKRRVAGYARVSTDKDEQFTSYEAQIDYYTQFIRKHPDWEYVDVYTDEGVSGLGTRKRDGFNDMVRDALAGKIDLIVTKSVSRFARNTVDSLSTIRKLKEHGTEVFFEKENIWTFDGKGELLLTIMASLAQEESRSISENVTWGQRKRFSDGKVSLPYKHFLGYEHGENKDDPPVINPEQAVTVQRIYNMFMEGMTACMIAKKLTTESVPTPAEKAVWRSTTVSSILQNEKYRGSAMLQKSFTTDFLTKKKKANEGEVPRYYIENSHEWIIAPEEWDAVQEEIARRKAIGRAYSGTSVLGAKIKCGDCGGWFGPKVWHSNDPYRARIWQCNCKFQDGKPRCQTPHFREEEVQARFLTAYNTLLTNKKQYLRVCEIAKAKLADTTEIDAALAELKQEMEVVAELKRKFILEHALSDVTEAFDAKCAAYEERYDNLEARCAELQTQKAEREKKAKMIDRFANELKKRKELLTVFDNKLWLTVVEYVTVHRDGSMTFHFNGGTEITL